MKRDSFFRILFSTSRKSEERPKVVLGSVVATALATIGTSRINSREDYSRLSSMVGGSDVKDGRFFSITACRGGPGSEASRDVVLRNLLLIVISQSLNRDFRTDSSSMPASYLRRKYPARRAWRRLAAASPTLAYNPSRSKRCEQRSNRSCATVAF